MNDFRIERDTMGEVHVPADKYWGAQTERSRLNFAIGRESSMPKEVVYALALVKKAAAEANFRLGKLTQEKAQLIKTVCDEILDGKLDDQFPLVIWQTGSGTQTNMNLNEVIANRAHVLQGNRLGEGKTLLHPNDDVNMSQSSNDVFPTAMNIAAYKVVGENLLPAATNLRDELQKKSEEFMSIVKIGRTHFMDATPLTLGQEFSGYVAQIDRSIESLRNTLKHLSLLAIGGTAVGTGLNAPKGFDTLVAELISEYTGLPFKASDNKFADLAAHDALVETHGSIKQLAISLFKMASDIRVMASGPRSGIAELILPANEPGSSIMPGKVNPTQIEALTMVIAQVFGNDVTISFANANGHFELNVFKPVMIANFLSSATLLSDACNSFTQNCLIGLMPNHSQIHRMVQNSLMLVTALNPYIGYDRAAQIAKLAYHENLTLKEAALKLGYLSEEEFDKIVDPSKMTGL
ncbi:MAG TPA: class II fumarate hydratase [Salinivirgaceae bacterium]|nr:class II fumarate hydratase [Salinivirgaceae bacterium]